MGIAGETYRVPPPSNPQPGSSLTLGGDPLKVLASITTISSLSRGQEIYGEMQPAEQWYRIISGLARKCAVSISGRRRIVDFLLPGDFFGFTVRRQHAFAVEAVADDTTVARYPRRQIEMIAKSDPELGELLRRVGFEATSRLQARIVILGRVTAPAKVGAFLLEMAGRLSNESDVPVSEVVLPMSRYDIADYLALSVETVSRAMTSLKLTGAITLSDRRRVRIVNRSALDNETNLTARRPHNSLAAGAARRIA
jgi:CRP/FNR family nitrogen fixation transcriptional regulator